MYIHNLQIREASSCRPANSAMSSDGFIQKDEMFSSQLTRTTSHCGRKALWPCVSEMTETIHVQNSTNHLNILGVHEYFTLTGGF